MDYFVESEVYALEPWSLLAVKHHTIHKALIDKSEPYDRVIHLDRKYFERIFPDMGIMDSFDAADRLGRHLLTPTEAEREESKRCLRDYEQCEADNGAGAQALRDTLIMLALSASAAWPTVATPPRSPKRTTTRRLRRSCRTSMKIYAES